MTELESGTDKNVVSPIKAAASQMAGLHISRRMAEGEALQLMGSVEDDQPVQSTSEEDTGVTLS